MRYRGICQCGHVAFEIEGEFAAAAASGRSASAGMGVPLWGIPRDSLRLSATEQSIGVYTLNDQLVGHRFCGLCGIHLYGEEIGPKDTAKAYVNPDCLQAVDPVAAESPSACP